jgi:hypothetical protein
MGKRIALIVLVALAVAVPTAAEDGRPERRRPAKERVRARPPAAWDKATEAVFFDDAFNTLEGERPDFAGLIAGSKAAPDGGSMEPAATGRASGGFKWSTLVSPDTLADEIKDMKSVVAKAVASASDFKGGGYEEARNGFSAIALAFGVIAAHDGDVRWKKDAEQARDLFARVGFNCKVGTAQSFAEAKTRMADLEALLEGNAIEATAEREEDFRWSQVAARPALMARLQTSDAVVSGATASKEDFNKQVETFLHEVEIVAAIGEAIQQSDYEYHDDDTYRGYAAAMRDAAVRAREAAQKSDYDAARTAVGELKKSCDTCHGDYRS